MWGRQITLVIKRSDIDDIFQHARKCYPVEACGILVGERLGEEKTVSHVYHTRNVLASSTAYQIDPEEQIKVFEEAEYEGLEILGFYHSHPFQDSLWSRIDEERSRLWIGYSYLIVSPRTGNVNSYLKSKKGVEEEKLLILPI